MTNEWDAEPNDIDFKDDATGLACKMMRGPWGSWCGYVAIPAGHSLHGKHYGDAVTVPDGYMDRPVKADEDYGVIALLTASLVAKPEENVWPLDLAVRCHGGITFAADHAPKGEKDGNWWLGFDCSHSGDLSPKLTSHGDDVYRNEAYVRASLAKMCSDIAALNHPVSAAA